LRRGDGHPQEEGELWGGRHGALIGAGDPMSKDPNSAPGVTWHVPRAGFDILNGITHLLLGTALAWQRAISLFPVLLLPPIPFCN